MKLITKMIKIKDISMTTIKHLIISFIIIIQ